MSVQLGWEALIRRDLEEAANQFSQGLRLNPENPEAYVGLARTMILMKRQNEAQPLAMQAARLAPNNVHVLLLRAELLGEQGKRAEAAQLIRQVISKQPSNSFALALLAEQRLRQGYWDDGITLFSQSLNNDVDERGFAHVREVIVDMSEAVAANKIPKVEALKLVNKLDYSTPNNSTGFFAMARRALQSSQPLQRNSKQATRPAASQSQAQALHRMASANNARSNNQVDARRAAPTNTRTSNSSNAQRQRQERRRREKQARDAEFELDLPDIKDQHELDFIKSIRRERHLNNQILEGLSELGRPDWPSDQPEPLDTLPQMVPAVSILSSNLEDYKKDPFKVTQGPLITQIYLERCLNAMLQRIPTQLAGTIAIMPEEVTQLEVNLIDGLIDDLNAVVTTDLQDIEFSDPKVCALGTFLGEAAVRAFEAAWEYDSVPTNSRVLHGGQRFDPFELAKQWLEAKNKDTVILQSLCAQVASLLDSGKPHTSTHEFIDLTKGLRDELVAIRLAELWSLYRLKLARVPAVEIARDIKLLETTEQLIIFEMTSKWTSPMPAWMWSRGKLRDSGKLAVAYIRETGEFVNMASVKGFARAAQELAEGLDESTATKLIEALQKYHLPGGTLIRTESAASQASERYDQPVRAPHLRRANQTDGELVFWEIFSKQARCWRLRYAKEAALPWRLIQG